MLIFCLLSLLGAGPCILVLISYLLIFFVIFSQLVAEIKSDAIQFDIVFVDCPNNLTEFLVIVFGLLLSICDQKDPFPVFLGAYKTAQHIHPNNKTVEDITFLFLILIWLKSLDMSEEVEVNLANGPLSCDVFVLAFSHLIVELV